MKFAFVKKKKNYLLIQIIQIYTGKLGTSLFLFLYLNIKCWITIKNYVSYLKLDIEIEYIMHI